MWARTQAHVVLTTLKGRREQQPRREGSKAPAISEIDKQKESSTCDAFPVRNLILGLKNGLIKKLSSSQSCRKAPSDRRVERDQSLSSEPQPRAHGARRRSGPEPHAGSLTRPARVTRRAGGKTRGKEQRDPGERRQTRHGRASRRARRPAVPGSAVRAGAVPSCLPVLQGPCAAASAIIRRTGQETGPRSS